uniref:Actin-like protein 3 n=1 Tax=Anopheles farauti TaxID=69004 RepID=A0A182QYL1_9DIPT
MTGRLPACVIDVGTGYTKLGFAANKEPQFIIPSAIAIKESAKVGDQSARRVTKGVEDLDFYIGDEAFDATGYSVKSLLREREVGIPPEQSLETAKAIKERYSYICPDIAKEFAKYDAEPAKWMRHYEGINAITKQPFGVDVGYERFLGPEIFFHPEFSNPDFTTPLSEIVDTVIQNCPIDVRRPLYNNIVLSGGSTMFRDFGRRLQRDIKRSVDARLRISENLSEGRIKPKPIDVSVISHHMQRYAVWFGGSMLASTPEFYQVCHTKAAYEEYGPGICRHNPVFGTMT